MLWLISMERRCMDASGPDRSKQGTVTLVLEGPARLLVLMHRTSRESHSTVSSGKAVPVRLKVSKPASSSMKRGVGISEPTASMALRAA